jgi:hypothetical protein
MVRVLTQLQFLQALYTIHAHCNCKWARACVLLGVVGFSSDLNRRQMHGSPWRLPLSDPLSNCLPDCHHRPSCIHLPPLVKPRAACKTKIAWLIIGDESGICSCPRSGRICNVYTTTGRAWTRCGLARGRNLLSSMDGGDGVVVFFLLQVPLSVSVLLADALCSRTKLQGTWYLHDSPRSSPGRRMRASIRRRST